MIMIIKTAIIISIASLRLHRSGYKSHFLFGSDPTILNVRTFRFVGERAGPVDLSRTATTKARISSLRLSTTITITIAITITITITIIIAIIIAITIALWISFSTARLPYTRHPREPYGSLCQKT
jgi:hypothetical protein